MRDNEAFVAVGGLGGSGTRVVAEILRGAGFYLGPSLNKPLDNLLFTFLFKRPAWFDTFPTDSEIHSTAEIFKAAMTGGLGSQVATMGRTQFDELIYQLENFQNSMGVTSAQVLEMCKAAPPEMQTYTGLAWKEPNTHIFVPQLAKAIPKLKYVHVIRNGLDMALSKNKNQLRFWGKLFGIEPNDEETIEQTQLRFWIAANKRIVDFGNSYLSDRFFLLNYDALCTNPDKEIESLCAFLEIDPSIPGLVESREFIAPTTQNRFKTAMPDLFSDKDRAAVRAFGFDV